MDEERARGVPQKGGSLAVLALCVVSFLVIFTPILICVWPRGAKIGGG